MVLRACFLRSTISYAARLPINGALPVPGFPTHYRQTLDLVSASNFFWVSEDQPEMSCSTLPF